MDSQRDGTDEADVDPCPPSIGTDTPVLAAVAVVLGAAALSPHSAWRYRRRPPGTCRRCCPSRLPQAPPRRPVVAGPAPPTRPQELGIRAGDLGDALGLPGPG
jgi:hypothetical protein